MTLEKFFRENPRAAVAFSGGVDSAYLLWAARQCGADIRAYYVKTQFQPAFELADAQRLAREIGVPMTVLRQDALASEAVAQNPADRCYYCKQGIFTGILQAAAADGYTLVLDGTNASDDAGVRPGMRALRELRVRSPLRECGLSKDEIRARSSQAGLFTWKKPAYACLATRIPTGQRITAGLLGKIERAEDFLFSLGFTDFRVRILSGCARLQLPAEQMSQAIEQRGAILRELGTLFGGVLLDLKER